MTNSDDDTNRRKGRNRSRHPDFEVALAARIRLARIAAGLSQAELGAAIGISFQQVQKYESGQSRVAVSTLQAIAVAVGVSPGSFFGDDAPMSATGLKQGREAQRILDRIDRLKNPHVLRQIMALIDALAGGDANGLDGAAKGDGHFPARDDPEMVP